MDLQETYQKLCRYVQDTAVLESTAALLEWDQQTCLPAGANEYRSRQITFLAGEIHRRRTDQEFGAMLQQLSGSEIVADPDSDEAAVVSNLKREYDKNVKVPESLVSALARETSAGHQTWVEARAADDYAMFSDSLARIVKLKQEYADAVGFEESRYDALLDDYEPGAKSSEVSVVLTSLRDELVPLLDAIKGSPQKNSDQILRRHFPVEAQSAFAKAASESIGYDYQRGRLDVAQHPFCTEMGPNDRRMTTRYDERFFSSAFFGTLHEAGHGIYEQGLRVDQYGLPTGKYCSLGIHESQSRLWENLVGRSRQFWIHFFPQAQEHFPESLGDISLDSFYQSINVVQPSLIRVEADEATYNLHIIIRFELERDLIEGQLAVEDLPAAWNDRYRQALGIEPPSDADGVLQDVHWSAGLFGYFSTYSLGNLYASQLFDAAESEIGELGELFKRGDFMPMKEWLNKHVHHHGQKYSSNELARRATGKDLTHDALVTDLRDKLFPLYGL